MLPSRLALRIVPLLLLLVAPVWAEEYTATMSFDLSDLVFYKLENYQSPLLRGCDSGSAVGAPILPWKPVNVALGQRFSSPRSQYSHSAHET